VAFVQKTPEVSHEDDIKTSELPNSFIKVSIPCKRKATSSSPNTMEINGAQQ